MRKFGTALSYHVPRRFQLHDPILGSQLVSAHSPWFQTEPLGPPCVCLSLFIVSWIVWSKGILPKGLLEPSLTWNPLAWIQHAHLGALCATDTSGRYNMGDSVHSSTCHMRSTTVSCRLQIVPWYMYRKLAIRLRKVCLWSWKCHPCGQHHRHEWLPAMTGNPCCFCCFSLTRSNRLQPIVIQSQRFLAIITVTCCMGPVCALVVFFTACQFVYAGR